MFLLNLKKKGIFMVQTYLNLGLTQILTSNLSSFLRILMWSPMYVPFP